MFDALVKAFESALTWARGARKRELEAQHEENRKEAEAEVAAEEAAKKARKP
jgi:hypothetical protein